MRTALDLCVMFAVSALLTSSVAIASDHGVVGQAFPIIEPDLLTTIEARLQRLQATGGIDRMNAEFAKRSEARVRRPKPVAGITAATEPRSWAYDPTIVIERDVQDQKGNYIARAGQTVNPLDFVAVHQALVFVDGDDAAQMEWATSQYSDLKAKIILDTAAAYAVSQQLWTYIQMPALAIGAAVSSPDSSSRATRFSCPVRSASAVRRARSRR